MMRNNRNYLSNRAKHAGFTLIEFLVASALSLIVIVAAGGTYFMTRQLNANAQKRLDVQQNLRNAASLITRDARNAGAFGCFSTASVVVKAESEGVGATVGKFPSFTDAEKRQLELDPKKNNGFGLKLISQVQAQAAGFNLQGVQFKGNAIAFIYGKGSASVTDNSIPVPKADGSASPYTLGTLTVSDYQNEPDISNTVASQGELVVSSCNDAFGSKAQSGSNNSITFAATQADELTKAQRSSGELGVTKLYASAYVVADVNNVSSLLRYDLNGAGEWQGPQLLAKNVTGITPMFGYVENCQNMSDDVSKHNQETFKFTENLNKADLPAVVRLHVTYRYPGSDQDVDYIINASVRSGSSCSTTLPV